MTTYNVDTLRKLIAEKRFGSAYLYVDYLEERLSKSELILVDYRERFCYSTSKA